jgi:pimeloyl-ACP methyl ester carboxylesterase
MRRHFIIFAALLSLFLTGCATPDKKTDTRANGPKYTYVIVHGAWGGGWAFKEVDSLLTADGHKVYRPTLTGQGEKVHLSSTNIDLDTHIADIVNVILWENLSNVVLVGHSYGGMVVTGVADRVPERIKHLIYVDALLPTNGESVMEIRKKTTNEPPIVDGYVVPPWLTNNTPLPHDVLMPLKTFTEPITLTNQAAVAKIPTTYILNVPKGTNLVDANFYRFYLRAQARGWTTEILQSDHNAQWSHPKELVRLLEAAP